MRRRIVLLALAGAAAAVLAAEPPAIAPASPSADPLDAARKDFEVVKATRANVPESKATTPRVEVPEMLALEGVNGGRAPLVTAAGIAADPKKRHANWLSDDDSATNIGVDAFSNSEKNRSSGDLLSNFSGRGVDSSGKSKGLPPDLGGLSSRMSLEKTERGREVERDPFSSSNPVINPLANYMAGWMTPRDFALLQGPDRVGWDADSPVGLSPVATAAGSSSHGTNVNFPSLDLDATAIAKLSAENLDLAKMGNPYLKDEDLYKPPPPPVAIKSSTAATSAMGLFISPNSAAGVGLPPARDLSKPSEDETYFKGLKRF